MEGKIYYGCEISFEILKKLFRNGDIVIDMKTGEKKELSMCNYLAFDGYYHSKDYTGAKVYDGKTGQVAEKVGFGVDDDEVHRRHTERFINSWKSSGLDKPRDYLDSVCRG